MIKKYTFQDWWEGKVCLVHCDVIYHTGDKQKVISVSWSDFTESDAEKIKAKQEELFESKRQELFKKWCDHFTSNYSRSELKSNYLIDEIFDIESILFNSDQSYYIENFELEGMYYVAFHLKNRNVSFSRLELNKIRDYVERRLKRGVSKRFDSIHSPNFPFQNKELIAPGEVYAQVCWDYLQWLKSFNSSKIGNNKLISLYALKCILENIEIKKSIKYGNHNKLAQQFNLKSGIALYNRVQELKREIKRSGRPNPKLKISFDLYKEVMPILDTQEAKSNVQNCIRRLESEIYQK